MGGKRAGGGEREDYISGVPAAMTDSGAKQAGEASERPLNLQLWWDGPTLDHGRKEIWRARGLGI